MPLASTNIGRAVTARSLNLHNVDNTPDSQKPVSQVQQVVINSTDAAADAAQARADAAHVTLGSHAAELLIVAEKLVVRANDIITAQNTADGAASAASQAQTTANSAVSAATQAQSTADTAVSAGSAAWTSAQLAQGTANGAQTAANGAQTTADSAQTAANGAQTTANSAVSAASQAQTTANGAQTAADGAQTTADSAVSAASQAQSTADSAQSAASQAQTTANGALTAVPSTTTQAIAANTAKLSCPVWVPPTDPSYLTPADASSTLLSALGNTNQSIAALSVGTAPVNLMAGAQVNGNTIATVAPTYYLNLGYNTTSGAQVHSITHNTPELLQLVYNNSRYTSTPTTSSGQHIDYSTSGTDAFWWCPSQTGIYLVICRAQFRAGYQGGDYLVEAALSLVKKNTSAARGYDTWVSIDSRNWDHNTNDQRDDRVFNKTPILTTIMRVVSTTEKYRMRVFARTYNGVTPWIMKNMVSTGMEVTKLA